MTTRVVTCGLVVFAMMLAACSPDEPAVSVAPPDGEREAQAPDATATTPPITDSSDAQMFPTVQEAIASFDEQTGTWTFSVTMSSPYDSPARYADGWRVSGPSGTVYGVHTLTHDHANEQPFTRRQSGVEIPASVNEITVEGRDLAFGFGGSSLTVRLVRT
jgi:hypothetical protein